MYRVWRKCGMKQIKHDSSAATKQYNTVCYGSLFMGLYFHILGSPNRTQKIKQHLCIYQQVIQIHPSPTNTHSVKYTGQGRTIHETSLSLDLFFLWGNQASKNSHLYNSHREDSKQWRIYYTKQETTYDASNNNQKIPQNAQKKKKNSLKDRWQNRKSVLSVNQYFGEGMGEWQNLPLSPCLQFKKQWQ